MGSQLGFRACPILGNLHPRTWVYPRSPYRGPGLSEAVQRRESPSCAPNLFFISMKTKSENKLGNLSSSGGGLPDWFHELLTSHLGKIRESALGWLGPGTVASVAMQYDNFLPDTLRQLAAISSPCIGRLVCQGFQLLLQKDHLPMRSL